jgi:hypothetical protein
MKAKYIVLLSLLLSATVSATEVTIDPNVSWYDTNEASVLKIWTTGTNCEPLKADPQSGPSKGQVLFWTAQLTKAQELNKSVGVGYEPSTCKIMFVGRMR